MPNSSAAEKAQHKLYPTGQWPAARMLHENSKRAPQWHASANRRQRRALTKAIGIRQFKRMGSRFS